MLEELRDYIGLSSTEHTTAAPSGLYVDALPDISTGLIAAIASEGTTEGAAATWENIQSRAILKFKTLFYRQINQAHLIKRASLCECFIIENKGLLAAALWYLLGAEVMLERINSTRLNRFTTIDKQKSKELRAEYMDTFMVELSTAVAGINPHDTACLEEGEVVRETGIISSHFSIL